MITISTHISNAQADRKIYKKKKKKPQQKYVDISGRSDKYAKVVQIYFEGGNSLG